MKFCIKCGAELVDEAVICTKCGRMVENQLLRPAAPIKVDAPAVSAIEKKPSTLLIVSNFVHSLGVALSLFFVLLSVGAFSYVSAYLTYEYSYGYNYIDGVYAYFRIGYELLIPAIIISGVALLFGILSFVMTLVEKHRGERLFSNISRVLISMISLACSIILVAN